MDSVPTAFFLLALGLAPCVRAEPPESGEKVSSLSMRLDSPEAERLRLDSTFDGSKKEPELPRSETLEHLGYRLDVQNGGLRRFAIVSPSGNWQLEGGQVGLVPRDPLIGASPYAGVRGRLEKEGALDASLNWQAGVLGLRSRMFYDDAPQLDVEVDSAIAAARSLAQSENFDHMDYFDWLQTNTQVGTSFQSQTMFVGSAVGQIGRVVKLAGPVDLGLVAGGLARVIDTFPDGSIDQTAALRVKSDGGISYALLAGVNEAVGLFDSDVWSRSLESGKLVHDSHLDVGPHVGVEAWGPLPKLSGSSFDAGGTFQSGPMTHWAEAHAEAVLPVRSGGVRISGSYEEEKGDEIGFARRRGAAELGVRPSPGLEIYGGYGRDAIDYGVVSSNDQWVNVGLRGVDGSGPRRLSLSIEQIFGGQDAFALPPAATADIIQQIAGLADFIDAVDAAQKAAAMQNLSSAMQQEIMSDPVAKESLGDLVRLAAALVQPEVYERIVIRFLRHELLEEMSKKPISILGQEVVLTPGALLALIGAYQAGLAPIPPLTKADADGALSGFLFSELKAQVGACADSQGPPDFTSCLLQKLPPAAAAKLQQQYGSQASQVLASALQWGAELVAREVDQEALQLMLASEQVFSELAADGGQKLTSLDRRWLVDEFEKKDRAGAGRARKMATQTRASLEAELKLKEKELKAELTAYGQDRLRNIPGVEIPRKDIAPLIAFYGDNALFQFVSAAKSRLPAGRKLSVEFTPFEDTGVMILSDDSSTTVRLPPLPPRTRSADFLGARLADLP